MNGLPITDRARTVLTLGECMVELAPRDDGAFAMGFAGDTFNSAWYLRGLLPAEWTVGFGSRIGSDALSDKMADFIAAAGIDTALLQRDPARTVGLYMIQLADGERSFAYWRGQSAARHLADDPDWLAGTLARAGTILISGITLAILPPEGRAALIAGLSEARRSGATVALDTNIRPRLWPDMDTLRATLTEAAGAAGVILPSFDEEQAIFGDASPAATAARYAAAGARMVVVKNGAEPGLLWTAEDGARSFSTEPVARVVDTTAAGDSFGAGLLAALLTGAAPDEAARAGAALSARVIQGKGALVPAALPDGQHNGTESTAP